MAPCCRDARMTACNHSLRILFFRMIHRRTCEQVAVLRRAVNLPAGPRRRVRRGIRHRERASSGRHPVRSWKGLEPMPQEEPMRKVVQCDRSPQPVAVAVGVTIVVAMATFSACQTPPRPPSDLIAKGKNLFFNETFKGNGRTCGTCHRAEANLSINPAFIATLPPNDPLFVAEFNPDLKKNFENPRLMRQFALILENLDGFEDLEKQFVMRGVPHVLSLRTSVNSPQGPRTGWSGDGAPGDGSLRSFATGAVIQHFTKTLNRVAGVDFRLPTDEELDALEAFQLSLGRQQDLVLPLKLKGTVPKRGQAIFLDNSLGKCNLCHSNAGATAHLGGGNIGNANFDTGVETLPHQPADLTGELVPPDDGFGKPGDGTFNTPPL